MGSTMFNIASSTLTPVSPDNSFFKFADDGYLVVPGRNINSIPQELVHHQNWAANQDLKLNISKTSEIVFYSRRSTTQLPPPIPGIARVTQLKILGIIVDEKLNFQLHINELIKSFAQALFVLKTRHHHGLSEESIQLTFTSKVLSKITYASPPWSGFISEGSREGRFLKESLSV